MSSPIVERIAKLVTDLPALPVVAQQALARLHDPTTEPEELQAVLSRDPALALKVLRMANSLHYRRGSEVTTLSAAVVVLGFKTIQTLVLSSAVHRVISGAGVAAAQLWEHSFAVGVACRELGRMTGKSSSEQEEAFLAGLFHDVGKAVIAAKFPGIYSDAPDLAGEEQALGFHHCHLGQVLLTLWGIPEGLCLAVAGHHGDRPAESARLVAVGDRLGWGLAPGLGAAPGGEDAGLADTLGLGQDRLEQVIENVGRLLAEEKGEG